MRWAVSALLASLLVLPAWARSGEPKIEETEFQSIPSDLFYFDDSDVVILTDPEARTSYRSDDAGVKWTALDGVTKGEVWQVVKHPFNNKVAITLGREHTHWITKDQGKSWKSWTIEGVPAISRAPISFHASDPDRILFMADECRSFICKGIVYYTLDGFATEPKKLNEDAVSCLWAKSIDVFSTGDETLDKKKIFCIVAGPFRPFSQSFRLLASSDFFATSNEPAMNQGRVVPDIINLAAVKHYIVAAAKSERTTELAMYVTDDGRQWHRAEFGEQKLEEDAYTLMESTNYSLEVDVMTTGMEAAMGVLLTSNSNGTFFTKNIEHTNRSPQGYVDFEKIQNIQGIMLANVVDNWEEVEKSRKSKMVSSRISFDDGRSWNKLKTVDGKNIQLHSVTEQRNPGRVFSSPAPGIVMGVGNEGESLKPWRDGATYVSDDAGRTWLRTLEYAHLYEFGDQGAIIVAVRDEATNKIKWSLNHGKDWKTHEIDHEIKALALTTVPDSTSLKFILVAERQGEKGAKIATYAIDFSTLGTKKCAKGDFQDWYARVDDDGNPTCIMGHRQKFRRRKSSAECLVEEEFKDPVPEKEDCKCTDADYECDYENGYRKQSGKCVLTGTMKVPPGECTDDKKTFLGSSGYRLVPGNTCVKKGGVEKDKLLEHDCKAAQGPPTAGEISKSITNLPGDGFVEFFYLECTASESCAGRGEEPLVARNDKRQVFMSNNHGRNWTQILKGEDIITIYPHQYLNGHVYFITPSRTVHYSKDHGTSLHSFEAPEMPNRDRLPILSFHPDQKDWLIWTGGRNCESGKCETIAHVSHKGGEDWNTLLKGVGKCQFVYRQDRVESKDLVICEQHVDENAANPIELVSSSDWFDTVTPLKKNVINFATMAEYIVVAVRDMDNASLQVDTSIDGQQFADAKFPPNFQVPHQQAYTVLDSSTHAVFLHVTVNNVEGQEYGSILKSNSNGSSYVLSASEVNRNAFGYVDFEKMRSLEGVAVINRVANKEEVDAGAAKKLKTYITHNDGADWALIPRPPKAGPGRNLNCDIKDLENCSLHLHGYTERKDPRDAYSSYSAVGMMVATGNYGKFLGSKSQSDTFLSRDGGITWEMAAEGNWIWEFGDQGSIIAMVQADTPTSEMKYSLDEGKTWWSYNFADDKILVTDLTSLPSDTSRNFLLWGRYQGGLVTINLDFTNMKERSELCKLDEDNPTSKASDYNLWSPKHPLSSDDCLFGHVAQYHRKKPGRECYNGGIGTLEHLHAVSRNCSCTRRDFECDYNFEKQPGGSCKLVEGLQPADPKAVCTEKPGTIEYYDITGYRRIPLSTCQGGKEMDFTSRPYPCPGKEPEFKKKHGASGVAIFFAVVIPILAAGGIGYWVWQNWDGRFGRIQLGGGDGLGGVSSGGGAGRGSFGGAVDREAPWIKYPVIVLSGVVAVAAAVPMLLGTLWSAVSTRLGRSRTSGFPRPYTSRNSFSRGRGDYAVVEPDDEGELLGNDSDEDI